MASDPSAHHRALAAFVTEHRDELEAYVGSQKETARLAEALLAWEREDQRQQEGRK
jgi:hypothetical protein